MVDADLDFPFMRLAQVIAPMGTKLVVIGGWAHQLHRRVELAQQVEFAALHTEDVDLATEISRPSSDIRLDEELTRVGFRAEPSGDDTPPVTRYVFVENPAFYVQFLAQRIGSGERRDRKSSSTLVVAGVVAESLAHIDILRTLPWSVDLAMDGDPRPETILRIHVANATSFIAQKLLIAPSRDRKERAKDLAYIHDTLRVFSHSLPALANLWASTAPELPASTVKNVVKRARSLCATTTDELREAAALLGTVPRPHAPSPSELREILDIGFRSIFTPTALR